MNETPPIPSEWIKKYVDTLLEAAKGFGPGLMRDATALRANTVMDMVEAWKGHVAKGGRS